MIGFKRHSLAEVSKIVCVELEAHTQSAASIAHWVFVQANDQASYLCVSGAGARDPAYQPFLRVIVAVARQPIDLGDKRVIVENMLHAVTLDQDQAGVDREGQVKHMGSSPLC
ncbi:hypothetical protein [Octadecabacter arcticus]|uniref:hypothetical protein n=1 Tax=Octadecabacter arcticus TaxID=53946 RepID=UPI0016516404|nr:hypothetical protein [Octadecabacter arcticus]